MGKNLEDQTAFIVSKVTHEASYGLKFPIKHEPALNKSTST